MGLFDGQPLTREDVIEAEKRRTIAEGNTIRRLSGGPTPVWRTVRHRPWADLIGPGPAGQTCGGCRFLRGVKYFKCGKQATTLGPGTDIRKKDPACRLFEEKEIQP